jgi:hypothetical protein
MKPKGLTQVTKIYNNLIALAEEGKADEMAKLLNEVLELDAMLYIRVYFKCMKLICPPPKSINSN